MMVTPLSLVFEINFSPVFIILGFPGTLNLKRTFGH